jgi:hypothetical protein
MFQPARSRSLKLSIVWAPWSDDQDNDCCVAR